MEFFAIRQQCTAKGIGCGGHQGLGDFSPGLLPDLLVPYTASATLVWCTLTTSLAIRRVLSGGHVTFVKKWCYFTHYCLSVTDF